MYKESRAGGITDESCYGVIGTVSFFGIKKVDLSRKPTGRIYTVARQLG